MSSDPVRSRVLFSIYRPKLWIASGLIILLMLCVVVWAAYQYGRLFSGFDQSGSSKRIAELSLSLKEQTAKKEEALRDNVRLSRGSDIQKNASNKVGASLAECETTVLKMKEELAFYQSVVAPGKAKRKIQINKAVMRTDNQGGYDYKVVLIQVGRHDVVQKGFVEISFGGIKAGVTMRLDLPTVSVKKVNKRQKFGFKYFQNFEGKVRFPDDFEPLILYVKALPKSSKVPRVEKSYPWAELINAGGVSDVGQ